MEGVAVNIEMTGGAKTSGDGKMVAGVEVGSVGHDIADRLSGRLYQLAQLYSDVGTVDAGKAAKPLLEEALRWDAKTNNVLGFASRLGLLSRILVVLGDFPKANQQITEQLDMLRERLLVQERSDTLADMRPLLDTVHGASKTTEKKKRSSVTHGQQRAAKRKLMSEQERDELFQALQVSLSPSPSPSPFLPLCICTRVCFRFCFRLLTFLFSAHRAYPNISAAHPQRCSSHSRLCEEATTCTALLYETQLQPTQCAPCEYNFPRLGAAR